MPSGIGLIAAGILFLASLFYRGRSANTLRVMTLMLLVCTVGWYYAALNSQVRELGGVDSVVSRSARSSNIYKRNVVTIPESEMKSVTIKLASEQSRIPTLETSREGAGWDFTLVSENGLQKKITWSKPVLFYATWCPHCDDVLTEIGKIPADRRPDLVSVYTESEDSGEEVIKAKQKLYQAGISDSVYVSFDDMTGRVETMPSLVRKVGGRYIVIKNPRQILNALHEHK